MTQDSKEQKRRDIVMGDLLIHWEIEAQTWGWLDELVLFMGEEINVNYDGAPEDILLVRKMSGKEQWVLKRDCNLASGDLINRRIT